MLGDWSIATPPDPVLAVEVPLTMPLQTPVTRAPSTGLRLGKYPIATLASAKSFFPGMTLTEMSSTRMILPSLGETLTYRNAVSIAPQTSVTVKVTV